MHVVEWIGRRMPDGQARVFVTRTRAGDGPETGTLVTEELCPGSFYYDWGPRAKAEQVYRLAHAMAGELWSGEACQLVARYITRVLHSCHFDGWTMPAAKLYLAAMLYFVGCVVETYGPPEPEERADGQVDEEVF